MKKYIWGKKDWHDFKYDHRALIELLAKARLVQGRLLGKITSLGIKLETEAQAEILIEEAVRTAEIEGLNLNRETVRSSVAMRLGLPHGVGIKKDRETEGLIDILLDAIRLKDKPLTIRRLNSWQASLFPTGYSGLHRIRAGKLRLNNPMRVISGPIGSEKVHFEAPPRQMMENELKLFIDWWNTSPGSIDGIIRAAAAHLRFITIHPYEDGNGRIARAITDMALAQDENINMRFYSMSSHIIKKRKEYYHILENVQNCRADVTEWFAWFLNTIIGSIKGSENIISNVFMKSEFWKEHAQTPINERQLKVIHKLLQSGPRGFTGGLTTKKYTGMTKVSRATAYREINDLLKKGIMCYAGGKGRSVRYQINWKSKK